MPKSRPPEGFGGGATASSIGLLTNSQVTPTGAERRQSPSSGATTGASRVASSGLRGECSAVGSGETWGTFGDWKDGHRRSRGVSVLGIRARLSRGRAVVNVRIRSRDRDACSGRMSSTILTRGFWVLAPRQGSWVAVRARIKKTGGGTVRLSRSECAPEAAAAPTAAAAQLSGYSPCLITWPGHGLRRNSGNGPRYVNGPVRVSGSDPYGLDSDGDGVGCEG